MSAWWNKQTIDDALDSANQSVNGSPSGSQYQEVPWNQDPELGFKPKEDESGIISVVGDGPNDTGVEDANASQPLSLPSPPESNTIEGHAHASQGAHQPPNSIAGTNASYPMSQPSPLISTKHEVGREPFSPSPSLLSSFMERSRSLQDVSVVADEPTPRSPSSKLFSSMYMNSPSSVLASPSLLGGTLERSPSDVLPSPSLLGNALERSNTVPGLSPVARSPSRSPSDVLDMNKWVKCPGCAGSFIDIASLRRHVKEQVAYCPAVRCEVCGLILSDTTQQRLHMHEAHQLKLSAISIDMGGASEGVPASKSLDSKPAPSPLPSPREDCEEQLVPGISVCLPSKPPPSPLATPRESEELGNSLASKHASNPISSLKENEEPVAPAVDGTLSSASKPPQRPQHVPSSPSKYVRTPGQASEVMPPRKKIRGPIRAIANPVGNSSLSMDLGEISEKIRHTCTNRVRFQATIAMVVIVLMSIGSAVLVVMPRGTQSTILRWNQMILAAALSTVMLCTCVASLFQYICFRLKK